MHDDQFCSCSPVNFLIGSYFCLSSCVYFICATPTRSEKLDSRADGRGNIRSLGRDVTELALLVCSLEQAREHADAVEFATERSASMFTRARIAMAMFAHLSLGTLPPVL